SSITNNIFEGIYRAEPEEGLVYANRALAQMFRYPTPEAMIADSGRHLFADPEKRDELLRLLESEGFYNDAEIEFVRADGSLFIGINNVVASRDADGRIHHFDGAIYDITERKQAEREVFQLAHYDALTGLPNRTMLNDHLATSISMAQRQELGLAVLFVDLDHFKTINDSLGHELGDRLLTEVARRMRKELRDGDLLSRQGGDEFLIVMNPASAEEAGQAARRLLTLLSIPFRIDAHELNISSSIGIALFPDDASSGPELIRNADAAMYLAKEKGRSNFQFFTAELNRRAHERLLLENDMRDALLNDEFELHYQPQIDLDSGRLIGLEALLRWTHPVRGSISPSVFIPVAEQSALMVKIGDWVIDRACRQLAEWRDGPLGDTALSINVSAVQFWRGTLFDSLKQALSRHRIPPEFLAIELTESALMEDAEQAGGMIDEISRFGIRVTIDDFGTGYSSLAYLKRFPIAGLKIDRSFVSDIASNSEDEAIVAAILSMAGDLKLDVIAEGVDQAAQIPILRQHGCQWVQGFLYSKPLSAEHLVHWASEQVTKA
ncbi:MAG: EAL domain-containing protein, partial [Pseudomonadota bacterium]